MVPKFDRKIWNGDSHYKFTFKSSLGCLASKFNIGKIKAAALKDGSSS